MVRQQFNNYFDNEGRLAFLPKYNRDLKPPSGGTPVFHHPFYHQAILPDLQAKVDIKFQDLDYKGDVTQLEVQQDACGFVIHAFGGHGGIIGKFDVSIFYRDPKPQCQPPPALPPPSIPEPFDTIV